MVKTIQKFYLNIKYLKIKYLNIFKIKTISWPLYFYRDHESILKKLRYLICTLDLKILVE